MTGNNTNYLDVILQHKYSQITTVLDSTPTTYNITNISGVTIAPHTGSATMQLSNGSTVATGTQTPRSVVFPTMNSKIIQATPVVINANNTNTGVLNIGSITMRSTIGNSGAQMTQKNISFNNLKISRV